MQECWMLSVQHNQHEMTFIYVWLPTYLLSFQKSQIRRGKPSVLNHFL